MSNRTTKHDGLTEDARWTRDRPPSGAIVCSGRPMAFWLPDGVAISGDSDGSEPDADDSGLGDDSPGADPVAGGQPKGKQI